MSGETSNYVHTTRTTTPLTDSPYTGWASGSFVDISNASSPTTIAGGMKFRLNGTAAPPPLLLSVSLGITGTINPVTNADDAGRPSITVGNVHLVPAKLRVNLDAVTDGNGVYGINYTATYRWQRMSGDGNTVEVDNIGTGPTYTLTADDVGKRVRVPASFADDAGHAEGPLTSAVTGW